MADATARHGDLTIRHFPARARGAHEHGARGGAGFAHLVERVCEGRASARALRTQGKVGVTRNVGGGRFDAELVPARVQLFGDQRGKTRVDALTHLQMLGHEGHGAVG